MSCDEILLEARDLGKTYEIYASPVRRLLQTAFMGRRRFYTEFKALESLTFSVKRGECLGIIGRNGAGKSTLLQLLCGTLDATGGEVIAHGRISALLELGFGFNPEFSGRDNIVLAGLMHGLSRGEIARKIGSIIEFAGIGAFIDRPVKTYSSGMFVRLAFAVAAHVDSEILLIDEALAVGDIFFQQKCYRYLEEQRAGKAVILVTHDLNAVSSLCDRVLVLDRGREAFLGEVGAGIECYTHLLYPGEAAAAPAPRSERSAAGMRPVPPEKRTGDGGVILDCAVTVNGSPGTVCKPGDAVGITSTFTLAERCEHPIIGFFFSDKFGRRIFGNCSQAAGPLARGSHRFAFTIRWPETAPQDYTLTLGIGNGRDVMAQQVCCWATDFLPVTSVMPSGIVHGVFNAEITQFEIWEC